MRIETTRFGLLEIDTNDIIRFPKGLIGLEAGPQWILLADPNNRSVGWLQSVQQPATALAVVSPRRFVGDYRVRVGQSQIKVLELGAKDRIYALCVISKEDERITMNLRAPVLINLDRRLGCQVITTDQQPIQVELPGTTDATTWRKTA